MNCPNWYKLLIHLPIGRGQREFSYWRSSTGKTAILYWYYYNQGHWFWSLYCVYVCYRTKTVLLFKFETSRRFNADYTIIVCYCSDPAPSNSQLIFCSCYVNISVIMVCMLLFMMIFLNSVAYRQMFIITSSSSGREAPPVMFFIHSRLLEELLKCQMLLGAGSYCIT